MQPAGLQTRVFKVNYLLGTGAAARDVRVQSGSITDSGSQAATAAAFGVPGTAGAAPPGGNQSTRGLDSSRVTTRTQNDFWARPAHFADRNHRHRRWPQCRRHAEFGCRAGARVAGRAARRGAVPAHDARVRRAPGDARGQDHRRRRLPTGSSPASTGRHFPLGGVVNRPGTRRAPSCRSAERRPREAAPITGAATARQSWRPRARSPAHSAPLLAPTWSISRSAGGASVFGLALQTGELRRADVRSSRRRATSRCSPARASPRSTTRKPCSRSAPTSSS